MRWMKHHTDEWDDEGLAAILDELPNQLMAYGFWWRLNEIVAARMKPGSRPVCVLPAQKWAKMFGVYPKVFEKYIRCFARHSKIILNQNENFWQVEIPNLLELKDKFTSDSERTAKQLTFRLNKDKDKDTDKDNIELKKTNIYSSGFEYFWQAYPHKVNKGAASKIFNALEKQNILPEIEHLVTAVSRQKQSRQWQKPQYIPHPATWLTAHAWLNEEDNAGDEEEKKAAYISGPI